MALDTRITHQKTSPGVLDLPLPEDLRQGTGVWSFCTLLSINTNCPGMCSKDQVDSHMCKASQSLEQYFFFSVNVAHTFSLQLGNADNLSCGSLNILPVLPIVMQTEPTPSSISQLVRGSLKPRIIFLQISSPSSSALRASCQLHAIGCCARVPPLSHIYQEPETSCFCSDQLALIKKPIIFKSIFVFSQNNCFVNTFEHA